MDLLDRLRPRWRHPDPDVRAAAVREMGEGEQDRLRTLAETDPEPRVRRVAIKKLDDPALLERIAGADADSGLRALAAERAREVLVGLATSDGPLAECTGALARLADERDLAAVAMAGAHDEVRRAALARVGGDRALRDVVRGAADLAIRREALERIQDPGMLRGIATMEAPVELTVRAVERIGDAATLRAIADNRGASKSARQRARELLAEAGGGGPAIAFKEGRARQLELCTAVLALRNASDLFGAAEQVRVAMGEWETVARHVPPRPDVAEQFETASATILAEAAGSAQRRAEVVQARGALGEAIAARRALCERIEALGDDDAAGLTEVRAAWSHAAAAPEPAGAALARRFRLACDQHAERHRRWRAREAARAAVERLVEEAEALAGSAEAPAAKTWRSVEQRWASQETSGLGGPEMQALAERFAGAAARVRERREQTERERAEQQTRNLARLTALCSRLEQLAGSETLKVSAARRELQAAEAALVDLGPLPPSERRAVWTGRLSEGRETLLRRLAREEEAEQWRRWANASAQQEIIGRIEALVETNDLAEGTRLLGRLQDDWARVATASPEKSQELWERFRTARNELRRRCDAYMEENLEKKRALCAEIAAVGESTAWNETAELIKRVQAQWKEIGPVPGRQATALWQQFREPCDQFFARRKAYFERLDGERRDNAARKTALCEQAEALADSTDWDTTATAVKRLQAEWKRTGAPPREQADVLWRRFRAACNRFFDRSRRRDELAREDELRKAGTLCDRVEALAAGLDGEGAPEDAEIGRAVDQAWAEWVHLDLAAGDLQALRDRLHGACARIASARPASLRGTRLDPATTCARRQKLCARAEELLASRTAAPRTLSLQEMAMALRDRLATNTIAGPGGKGDGPRQDVGRELERIEASWINLGPVLDDDARVLEARFEQACARLRDAGA